MAHAAQSHRLALCEHQDLILKLPVTVVVDHMAGIPEQDGVKSPAYTAVRRLIDGGKNMGEAVGPRFWLQKRAARLRRSHRHYPSLCDCRAAALCLRLELALSQFHS